MLWDCTIKTHHDFKTKLKCPYRASSLRKKLLLILPSLIIFFQYSQASQFLQSMVANTQFCFMQIILVWNAIWQCAVFFMIMNPKYYFEWNSYISLNENAFPLNKRVTQLSEFSDFLLLEVLVLVIQICS